MTYPWQNDLTAILAANPTFTDEQCAAAINALTVANPAMVFGSFRTLAGILTSDEYNTLRAALTSAAAAEASAGGSLINDMIGLMKVPGDQAGNGGGVDFTNPAFIAQLTALCTAASLPLVVGKVQAYCNVERPATVAKYAWVRAGDVNNARNGIG